MNNKTTASTQTNSTNNYANMTHNKNNHKKANFQRSYTT